MLKYLRKLFTKRQQESPIVEGWKINQVVDFYYTTQDGNMKYIESFTILASDGERVALKLFGSNRRYVVNPNSQDALNNLVDGIDRVVNKSNATLFELRLRSSKIGDYTAHPKSVEEFIEENRPQNELEFLSEKYTKLVSDSMVGNYEHLQRQEKIKLLKEEISQLENQNT